MAVPKVKVFNGVILGICFLVTGYAVVTRTYDLKTAHTIIQCLEAGMCITVFLSCFFVYMSEGFYKLKVKQFLEGKIKKGYLTQDYEGFMKEFDEVK